MNLSKPGYLLPAMNLSKAGLSITCNRIYQKSGYLLLAMDLSKSSFLLLAIDLSKVELSLAMNFLKDELSSAKQIYQRQSHLLPYSGLWIISLFRLKHFIPDYILSTPEKE